MQAYGSQPACGPTRSARAAGRFAGVAAGLLLLSACQSAGGPPLSAIATAINSTLESDTVVLGVGDELALRFPYSEKWNQEVMITTDGSASFLAVGRLIVAGMSIGQLSQTLSESYSHVFEDHELDVMVTARGARMVYVMGEVHEPGEFELAADGRLTLLDALARAGGPLKQSAYLAHTLLIRWNSTTRQQLSWTIDAREEHWPGSEPVYLQPYDLVWVPNTPVDDVNIWIDKYIRQMIPFPYIIPPVY